MLDTMRVRQQRPSPDFLQAFSATKGDPLTGSCATTLAGAVCNLLNPSNSFGLNNLKKLLKTQKQRAAGGIKGRIWVNITCSFRHLKNLTLTILRPSLPSAKSVASMSGKCQTRARDMCCSSPRKCSGYIAIPTLIRVYTGAEGGDENAVESPPEEDGISVSFSLAPVLMVCPEQ